MVCVLRILHILQVDKWVDVGENVLKVRDNEFWNTMYTL